jgi:hypothetical protein
MDDPIADDRSSTVDPTIAEDEDEFAGDMDDPTAEIPLAIARVYNLPLVGVFDFSRSSDNGVSARTVASW